MKICAVGWSAGRPRVQKASDRGQSMSPHRQMMSPLALRRLARAFAISSVAVFFCGCSSDQAGTAPTAGAAGAAGAAAGQSGVGGAAGSNLGGSAGTATAGQATGGTAAGVGNGG